MGAGGLSWAEFGRTYMTFFLTSIMFLFCIFWNLSVSRDPCRNMVRFISCISTVYTRIQSTFRFVSYTEGQCDVQQSTIAKHQKQLWWGRITCGSSFRREELISSGRWNSGSTSLNLPGPNLPGRVSSPFFLTCLTSVITCCAAPDINCNYLKINVKPLYPL